MNTSTAPLTKREIRKLADIYVNSLTEDPAFFANVREDEGWRDRIYVGPFEVIETAQNNGTLRVEGQHDVVDYETDEILAEFHVTLTITRAS